MKNLGTIYINESEGYIVYVCVQCTYMYVHCENSMMFWESVLISCPKYMYMKTHFQKCRFGTIGACSYLLGKGQFKLTVI